MTVCNICLNIFSICEVLKKKTGFVSGNNLHSNKFHIYIRNTALSEIYPDLELYVVVVAFL